MKTKSYLWECPNGCKAVRAPSRPRKDDVRRYCLKCSERTGRLVERTAPVLERQREQRAQRATDKRKDRERKAYERKYVVQTMDGAGVERDVDLLKELKRFSRLKTFDTPKGRRARARLADGRVTLLVGHSRANDYGSYIGGRAWPYEDRLRVYGPATARWGYERTLYVLLHEWVHMVTLSDCATAHDITFKRVFADACNELWPDVIVGYLGHGSYVLGDRVVEQLRAAATA